MLKKVCREFLKTGTRRSKPFQSRSLSVKQGTYASASIEGIKRGNAELDSNPTPWYLRDAVKPILESPLAKNELPQFPPNSPHSLHMTISHMATRLGLTNFIVFDMRNRDDDLPISAHTEFVIVCEGKSEKHLQNSSQNLVSFLKNVVNTKPSVEGLMKPNSQTKIKQRLKKTGKTHKNTSFGVESNSWIIINTPENISLHLLSPQRRIELNLEELFCAPIDRPRYQHLNQLRTLPQQDSDSIFAGIFKRNFSTATPSDIFERRVLDFVENDDMTSFEELNAKISSSSTVALSVLKSINSTILSLDVECINDQKLQRMKLFFDKGFPTVPEISHFEERLIFFRNLFLLSPESFSFNYIAKALKLQVESGISLTEAQVDLALEVLKTLDSDNQKCLGLLNIVSSSHKMGDIFANRKFTLLLLDLFVRSGGVSPYFNDLVSFLKQYKLSNESVGFIINALIQSNSRIALWSFWDSLGCYSKETDNDLVLDSRPWDILISKILENSISKNTTDDAIVNDFFNIYLPQCTNLNRATNKRELVDLLNRFDQSGKSYIHLRELINQ